MDRMQNFDDSANVETEKEGEKQCVEFLSAFVGFFSEQTTKASLYYC